MIKPLLAGNWKMHKSIQETVDFVENLKKAHIKQDGRMVVIAPPFTALSAARQAASGTFIRLAAQNLSDKANGAFTGEISAHMLKDVGCEFVIIGHSERRTVFGEKNADINNKIKMALNYKLYPILCVGETLQEREKNITFEVVERQLKEGLNKLNTDDIRRVVIAYEPVWAIGTGKTATPDKAQEVHAFIRGFLSASYGKDSSSDMTIIYGGSVNPGNIGELMAQNDINGALVGGASLEVDSFIKIINY